MLNLSRSFYFDLFPSHFLPEEDTLLFVLANAWCAVVAMVIISCNELVL